MSPLPKVAETKRLRYLNISKLLLKHNCYKNIRLAKWRNCYIPYNLKVGDLKQMRVKLSEMQVAPAQSGWVHIYAYAQ